MTVLLLHCYSPHERPEDQVATWEFVEKVREERPGIKIVDIPCTSEGDYPRAWAENWDFDGTLVNLEHDLVPTLQVLDELIDCPSKLCTQAYKIYPLSTALDREVFVQRLASKDEVRFDRWVLEGDAHADYTGLGLAKLEAEVRSTIPTSNIERYASWKGFDFSLSNLFHVQGKRWHIHWPAIPHHHQ